jgi:hypothetical protein
MTNVILPPLGINPAAILDTIEGAAEVLNRRLGRERYSAAIASANEQAAATRRRNLLDALGLTEAEWPEYQRIMAARGFSPSEAAGIVIRSRRVGQ